MRRSARQYLWTHRSWSPVGDLAALAAAARDETADLDCALSAAAWHGGHLAAVVFAFRTTTQVEVVAETLDEAEPDGERRLAQVIAFMLRAVRRQPQAGERAVPCDGMWSRTVRMRGTRREHWQLLIRQAMHDQGEQIHVAAWPDMTDAHRVASLSYVG